MNRSALASEHKGQIILRYKQWYSSVRSKVTFVERDCLCNNSIDCSCSVAVDRVGSV